MPVVTLTAEERVGTLLAEKYELGRILGEGGMGVVFEATHKWTGRRVAVKLLHATVANNPDVSRRFLQEARTAAALEHPNVVQVLDMGSDEGTIYLVLELLEGEALAERLERGGLSIEETLHTLLPVMNALASAHDKNILHRDLKPENIFLSVQGGEIVPKVLDFGLAKVVQEDPTVSSATHTGIVIGTPHYLAPEQAKAERNIGPPVDVWAMGVVAYECLTGAVPFQGDSATAIVVNVCTEDPIPPESINPQLPPVLIGTILRALAKKPAQRYQNMRAFANALVSAAQSAGIDVPTPKGLSDLDSQQTTLSQAPRHSSPSMQSAVRAAPTPSTWDQRSPSMRSRTPLLLAGVGGVLLLGAVTIGVGIYAITQSDEEPVPEATSLPVEADPASEAEGPAPAAAAEVAPAAPATPAVVEPPPSAPVVAEPVEPTPAETAPPSPTRVEPEPRTTRRVTRVIRPRVAPTPMPSTLPRTTPRRTSLSNEF